MGHKSRLLATILLLPCIATALPLQLRWRAETSDPKPFRAAAAEAVQAEKPNAAGCGGCQPKTPKEAADAHETL